jgi:hypothetical protein
MRDNRWLEDTMYKLWENHFNDIPRKNLVLVKFGKRARRQLGCISWVRKNTRVKRLLSKKAGENFEEDDNRITLITITSLFKNSLVPEYVIESTIAHEMIHYAHGFNSPLHQQYNHPHKGGIIRKEMIKRGLGDEYKKSKKWLKENWKLF